MRRIIVATAALWAVRTAAVGCWRSSSTAAAKDAAPTQPPPADESASKKIEDLANVYTQLTLKEITQLQRLVFKKLGHSDDFYEKALLRAMGGGGGGGGGAVSFQMAPQATGALPPPSTGEASPEAAPDKPPPPKKPQVVKTMFDVHLVKFEATQKIQMIKALRTVVTLPMKEAKELIDKAPGVVAKALNKEDAEKLKTEMEKFKAEVKLV